MQIQQDYHLHIVLIRIQAPRILQTRAYTNLLVIVNHSAKRNMHLQLFKEITVGVPTLLLVINYLLVIATANAQDILTNTVAVLTTIYSVILL